MIAVLGPTGSYGEIAAKSYKKNAKISFYETHEKIMLAVKNGNAKEGIVAAENMIHGTVTDVWDLIYENKLKITKEIVIPIELCLAINKKTRTIKEILSHPVALEQAKKYIVKKYPDVKCTIMQSTSSSMSLAKNKKNAAAIGNILAAKKYGLDIIDKNIEDYKNNRTRFFVVSKKYSKYTKNKEYKTSISVFSNEDSPGLLYKILTPFAKSKINLTRIESRPTKKKLGTYIFYIDLIGHFNEPKIKKALDSAKKLVSEIKILGSYDSDNIKT